jgi:hypothetical protein
MNRFAKVAPFSIFSSAVSGVIFLMAASLCAQPIPPGKPGPAAEKAHKLTASAIQIERIDRTEELLVPEDFRISTYENVILQVTKTKRFQHVYRSGDSSAAGVPDLVTLHIIPQAFKEGSQKKREVTTIMGATSIKMKVQFTSSDGKVLLDKDLQGKVRFSGENLRATYDLSKKVASVVKGSF